MYVLTLAYKSFKSSSVERGLGLDRTHAGKLRVFNADSPVIVSSFVPNSSNTVKKFHGIILKRSKSTFTYYYWRRIVHVAVKIRKFLALEILALFHPHLPPN